MSRYKDAYRTANATVGMGTSVKFVGILVIAASLFYGLYAIVQSRGGLPPESFLSLGGVFAGLSIFGFGVLISAAGQMEWAALDGAVNGSPILTNEERAEIMGLGH